MHILLDSGQLHKHRLYLDIVVLSHVDKLSLELIDLAILALLAIDEENRVAERLIFKMLHIVLPEDFDLAAELIVGTANNLVLASIPVAVEVLPLDLLSAFVFALHDLVETAFIVLGKVLEDYDCRALLIRTMDLPKVASTFVDLHLFPLKPDLASYFEQAVAFERALDDFVRTLMPNMSLNLSSFNLASTLVSAFYNVLWALCCYVLLHVAERKSKAALKQTFYYAIGALFDLVLVHVLPQNESAVVTIWAS
jgi:hypothetical protein